MKLYGAGSPKPSPKQPRTTTERQPQQQLGLISGFHYTVISMPGNKGLEKIFIERTGVGEDVKENRDA